MSQKTESANTPFFVLKNGNQPVNPTINFDDPNANCVCVYGFSDKSIYEKFIKSSGQLLTPYPLLKRYLENQIAEIDSAGTKAVCLGLVVLDATKTTQPLLSAATMAAVLHAQQEKAQKIFVEYELAFDPKTASYFFKSSPQQMPPRSPAYISK